MMILLCVVNLSGAVQWVTEKFSVAHPRVPAELPHLYENASRVHFHRHSHALAAEHHGASLAPPGWLRRPLARLGLFHALRPLFVGIVHGLAGSAAVALLVLGTIHDPRWALLYLLIFGAGTVAGMMLITVALALPFSFAGSRFAWLDRGFVVGSGVVSLSFGLFVCYQIGFAAGLFTSHPHWTPS